MRTAIVAVLALAGITTLSACGVNPPKPTTTGPAALLDAARQAQAAPNVAALSTACSRLTAALAAPSVQTAGISSQWQSALTDLNQAQSICAAIVNTTPTSQRAATPTSRIDLTTSMTNLLTSGIGLLKAITDLAPSTTSSTIGPAPVPSSSTTSTPSTLPYTITVHIDDQPLATPDGRTMSAPVGNVGLSYMTDTYQCVDGMVCGGTLFHYAGGMITLTAGWDPTSKFLGWEGAPCQTANVCRFDLTSNLDVTAHFAPATYTLTIDNFYPDGGSVVAGEGEIGCGEGLTECSALERSNVPVGIHVSGTMAEPTDYDVILVKGPGCNLNLQAAPPTSETSCSLTRSQDTTIDVNFSPAGLPNPY